MVGDGFSLIFMDTVSGTVYHKSKKFPIYAGAESPANYTTASESHDTPFLGLLSSVSFFRLGKITDHTSPYSSLRNSASCPYLLYVSSALPTRPRAGLPDGPPATTATITAAPNPTQQWAITLDGTVVGGEVSICPLASFGAVDDGMADGSSLLCGVCAWLVGYLVGTGHFDRGRPWWRALSKISIAMTLSSFLPVAPRPDLDLIDDTYSHISRLHESSRQPSSTTTSDAPPSSSPLSRLHLTQYIPIILVSS
jgi:hypothetical protein